MTQPAPDLTPSALAKRTILIIDDDEVDRMACRRTLARHRAFDMRIVEAALGAEGIRAVKDEHPDMVLLDYRLPDADGITVLRQIGEVEHDHPNEAPSVVIMTGARDLDIAVDAMRLGARDYLVKDGDKTYLELLPAVLDRIHEERALRDQMRQAEDALRTTNERLEQRVQERTAELVAERQLAMITLTSIVDAVFVMDNEGRVLQMNPAAEHMTGTDSEALIGQLLCDRITFLEESSRHKLVKPPGLAAGLPEDTVLILVREDGEELFVRTTGGKMHDTDGKDIGIVTVLHDITRLHARSHALMYQATHDALTDLPNRLLFTDRLSQSINHAGHNDEKLAVVFLDLDGFKQVNDTFGHQVGDYLLQSVAQRLQGCIRESDSLARLSGDEFTMAVAGKGADRNVQMVAAKVLREMTAPFDVDGKEIRIGISLGISIFPDDGTSIDELMEKADAAMYEAKALGGSAYRYYSPGSAA
ncbi:diguanylate cyclase domain-containing protein [Noviherbaspirillum sp.]|uniref:diguanylate cyclase domain-containing protein n=1 Tax=Noviherbaspirillum sp. TaxID=1926288 RepID=UPI002B497409|nr:diguanylate cyclase [Noviherbaspirillum sp.]HJV79401.1 diguanylate cyclase [Noviherbaspirillum sp.]